MQENPALRYCGGRQRQRSGAPEAPVHGTPSRYATACCNRSVHWPRVRPRSLPADRHSDPSCDNGSLLYPGEDEGSDHDSYLAGRGGLCLVCDENPVYAFPLSCPTQCSLCEACTCSGAKDAATSRALSATTPRPTDGALAARAPTRTDSLHPPCTKSDPTWCTGEVVMEAGGGWGEWAPTSPQSGWCFVEASISGQRRMCCWSALSHICFGKGWR